MSKTTLCAVALASLVAISGAANAGTTISDQRYWPNEVRTNALKGAAGFGWSAAYAAERRAPLAQVIPAQPRNPYHGGPKSTIAPPREW